MEGCLNILCVFSCWGGKFRGCCRFLSKSNRCGVFTYDLNVFPVPDGDTGSNMSMTLCSSIILFCFIFVH